MKTYNAMDNIPKSMDPDTWVLITSYEFRQVLGLINEDANDICCNCLRVQNDTVLASVDCPNCLGYGIPPVPCRALT